MKRLAPFLLLLLGAPAALAQSSAGALATARIVRPLARLGPTATSSTGIELSCGAERLLVPLSAERADLAVEITAPASVNLIQGAGPQVLISRIVSPPASGVVSITIHNR